MTLATFSSHKYVVPQESLPKKAMTGEFVPVGFSGLPLIALHMPQWDVATIPLEAE